MGKALYRKYRSKSLAEVVGQEHITRALSRALEKEQISHAYLFTGPRGVGKTSVARIMAHEVNGLAYDEAGPHLDIIEIDAASNRRIDEVRDLREKVHVAPTSAKYKVYIIDEVHMLTREAFNALLKTLEEPPAHALFILATTEAHKLPETIVSRTQHFAFKPLDRKAVVGHLANIAESEGIKISEDALELVADHGGGSFRDSISLLDQIKNYADAVERTDVEQLLGVAPVDSVDALVDAMASRQAGEVIRTLQTLKERGVEPSVLATQLSERLQQELLADAPVLPKQAILALLARLIDVPASAKPLLMLEICLLEAVFANENTDAQQSAPAKPTPKPPKTPEPKQPTADAKQAKPVKPDQQASQTPETPVKNKTQGAAPASVATEDTPEQTGEFDIAAWPDVLAHIKKSYNTMYGVLRMAVPHYESGVLTLSFRFPFHQKRVGDVKNQTIILDAIKTVTGARVKLECVVAEEDQAPPEHAGSTAEAGASQNDDSASLTTVSNIFGGGELLKS